MLFTAGTVKLSHLKGGITERINQRQEHEVMMKHTEACKQHGSSEFSQLQIHSYLCIGIFFFGLF